jgi:PAS domain S-box-containing protein
MGAGMVAAKALFDKIGVKQLFSETALLGRLADYRQCLAALEAGVAVIGIEGTLQFVNDAWATMHGYTDKVELIGDSIKQFYAETALDDFNRFVAQTKLHGCYIATIEQTRKDRTSYPAQLKMAVIKDDLAKPAGILLIVADLSRTSRMQKEIELVTGELETLKARLNQLEQSLARRNQPVDVLFETNNESNGRLLPIAELKQLSEMAKRFR